MQRPAFIVLRWSWLLGIALLAPATLPAGGADRRQPEVRRRSAGGPLISGGQDLLQAAPHVHAPALRRLDLGTPLQVLRRWRGENGQEWLQVQVTAPAGADHPAKARRGWVHG
ncbi:MAG: SH3 domain-containing protein [Synechococcus sp.]